VIKTNDYSWPNISDFNVCSQEMALITSRRFSHFSSGQPLSQKHVYMNKLLIWYTGWIQKFVQYVMHHKFCQFSFVDCGTHFSIFYIILHIVILIECLNRLRKLNISKIFWICPYRITRSSSKQKDTCLIS